MHIHLPKPLHGWREFLGEVGIIVLGVLIALGAEQVIEGFHWRHEVELGREALESQLEDIAAQSVEREALSSCLGRRFQEIAAILDQASASGRLPPVGPIGNPANRLWHLQAWDSLMAAQTATHFPKQEMLALGGLAAYLRTVGPLNEEEFREWAVLWTIVGPGRRLAAGEEPQLRQALSRAAYDAKLMRISAQQLLQTIRDNKLLSRGALDEIARNVAAELKKQQPDSSLCNPLGAAPAHYGDSPLKLDLLQPFTGE